MGKLSGSGVIFIFNTSGKIERIRAMGPLGSLSAYSWSVLYFKIQLQVNGKTFRAAAQFSFSTRLKNRTHSSDEAAPSLESQRLHRPMPTVATFNRVCLVLSTPARATSLDIICGIPNKCLVWPSKVPRSRRRRNDIMDQGLLLLLSIAFASIC